MARDRVIGGESRGPEEERINQDLSTALNPDAVDQRPVLTHGDLLWLVSVHAI